MPVPVSQGRVKKFTTDGPIPPPHSRHGVVPQVDPTKKPAAAPGQLLGRPGASRSPTRRGRGVLYGRHPPYRLLRPASLSPLLPTAMPGWGMATPPIRAFPQRRPARSTPCKPKGSVLPRFIGPGGRARRAKKCIGLRVGGAKRVAASKGRIAAEKEAGPIPLAVVLQGAMAVAIGKKGGRCRDLSPPPGGPCKTRSLFPPRCQIGAVGIPHQAVCPCLRPCPGSPGRQPHISAAPLLQRPLPSGRGKLLCPQWSAPFPRAVRLPATEIAGKPGRGRTSPLPDRGSSARRVDFAGAAPYNIGWFIV